MRRMLLVHGWQERQQNVMQAPVRQLRISFLMLNLWLLLATAYAQLEWTKLIPGEPALQPPPRTNMMMGYLPTSNMIVIFGGSGNTGTLNDTWLWDINKSTWQEVMPTLAAPWPRPTHTAVTGVVTGPASAITGELFIIATGTSGGSAVNNEVWAFSVSTPAGWRQIGATGDGPSARYGAVGGIWPGTDDLYLTHGLGTHRQSDSYRLNLTSATWTKVHRTINPYEPFNPHPRCLGSGTLTAPGSLVLYGGCMQGGYTGGPCPARDGWVLDFDPDSADQTGSWKRVDDGPSPRTHGVMVRAPKPWISQLGGSRVILYGGFETGKQVEEGSETMLDVLDPEAGEWYCLEVPSQSTSGPGFRGGAGGAVDEANGKLYIFGGQLRGSTAHTNDLYVLSLSSSLAQLSVTRRGRPSSWFLYPHLHGIFMGLAWGIFIPMGVMIARYMRHRDPLWFELHKACQVSGVMLTIIGFILVWVGGANNPVFAHGLIGIILMAFAIQQVINALLRPHKGEPRRQAWEWLHVGGGHVALALGVVNVSLGTFLIAGPSAVWIAWFVILGTMGIIGTYCEVQLWRSQYYGKPMGGVGGGAAAKKVKEEEAAEQAGIKGDGGPLALSAAGQKVAKET